MGQALSTFIQALVTEEIRRIVAEAAEDGSTVSSTTVAAQVISTYPNCGLNEAEIADQVMMAAAKSGVAVELGGERRAVRPPIPRKTFVRRRAASRST